MRLFFTSILVLFASLYSIYGQNIVEWSSDQKLAFEDFQSAGSEISSDLNSSSFSSGTSLSLAFNMPAAQFMFTKNFNPFVTSTFQKNAGLIAATDSLTAVDLVSLGQYCFDLTELYARKLRKSMLENKVAFSKGNFFEPFFQQLQADMTEEAARVMKITELGKKRDILEAEQKAVIVKILELADYCKECKPPKLSKKSQ